MDTTGLPMPPEDVELFLSEPDEGVREALRTVAGDFVVLGAGGKMGLHFCLMLQRALASLGRPDRVVAVSRFQTLHSTADFVRYGIETWPCDLAEPDQLAALPDFPNVFFLAGAKFGTAHQPEVLQRMNVYVPQLVAERYRLARIVALSTGCVYSYTTPASGGSLEADETAPVGDYARSCLGREQAFGAGCERHGTRVTLVRLNYSVEFRYGVLLDICGKVLHGEPVDVAMGYVNVIWQRDAVAQIIRTLPLANAPPFIINVTGPETLSVRELAQQFAQVLQQPATIAGVESPTAWLSNSAQAQHLLGPPQASLPDLIRWTTEWLRTGGATYHKPTGFEKRDGNF